MTSPVRPPVHAQAGWYPRAPDDLGRFLAEACATDAPAGPALAVLSPHAGYRFSGGVAGAAFGRREVPDRVVVLGVSHRPPAARVSVGLAGAWAIPGAEVPIDEALAQAVLEALPGAEPDPGDQRHEHSLELQVPFLHFRNPGVRIVPVQVGQVGLQDCLALGRALAGVLRAQAALMVASTDMHHQEYRPNVKPAELVPRLDDLAIAQVEALDPEGLFETVRTEGISMCGVRPATIVLQASKELGASGVESVRHATSYDVTGDDHYVVGYYSALVR